ncbi:MAG: sodium/proton-translocating pyrophosphatase, partial [Eudoraea sp.]|nr:sodium/proton-translocating pyrophosphatase [Eudoraea sp.]
FRDIPQLKAALEVMRKYDSDMSKASDADRAIFDEADGVAEYDKCVAISTKASIKEMVLPGLLAIAVPVAIGFIGGAEMLGGLLAGVTTCGVLMAIFQSNAGGAWDNAKKMIEEQGKKGTDAHKAAVVGDTVGDPFKDTSGPSLNILLKLMSVVALVIAPSIALSSDSAMAYSKDKMAQEVKKEVQVRMESKSDDLVVATVTTTTTKSGESSTEEQVFEGTEQEVKAKIDELHKDDSEINIRKKKVIKEVVEEKEVEEE